MLPFSVPQRRAIGPSTRPLPMAIDTELITELVISGTLGLVTDPLVEMLFNVTELTRNDNDDFETTFAFGIANSISLAARLFFFVLLASLAVDELHLYVPIGVDLREADPKLAATIWAAGSLSTIKRTLFLRAIDGRKLGRVTLYDRLLDFLIGLVTAALILDELQIDVGMGLQSVLAGSGFGALAFSLASKDLATQIVSGFVAQAWDAFKVGDDIILGDGTAGTVSKIGLVETEIVGYDNIATRIPNSQLATERISNVSRIKQSRVYQTLRFQYSDLDKLPIVLNDIKEEIKASCPKVILDGSKPFQAVLSQYETDHVQAYVNCHFNISPGTDEYVNIRQLALLTIARALKKYDIQIALPSIVYQTNDPNML